ncbi:MAG: hypothetical protein ACLUD0_04650 [Eubacterium ramulus]
MEHILGELRLNGLVSLEREAYEQMDVGLQGKSEVIPLTLNKDGSVSKRGTSGAAPVDFTALTAFVNRKIRGAAGANPEGRYRYPAISDGKQNRM